MVYGIDLGTTNSLIGSGDEMFTSMVSSKVDIVHKKQVERNIVSDDVVASYKTDMSMGDSGKEAIICSSVILKDLADRVQRQTGNKVEDVVVSVPAYFSTSQREAVKKASELAGLNLKCIINEPTAAALCVCKDLKDLIIVYDLGGGTFDISIVDARTGNYSVVATDGEVLGGDDLDWALVDDVIKEAKIPIRYRNNTNKKMLKNKVCQAKEELQQLHSDVYIDLIDYGAIEDYVLTVDKYKKIVKDVFYETVVRTMHLISTNLPTSESPKLIFVGGSTNCPYLKQMVKDSLGLEEITSEYIPDLIVAKGVAMYAKMYEDGIAFDIVDDVTKRLCIEDSEGKTITIIDANTMLPAKGSIVCTNSTRDSELRLKLYQGDSFIASKNAYVGTLVYKYGRVVDVDSGMVEVVAEVTRDGIVKLSAQELLRGAVSRQEIELEHR